MTRSRDQLVRAAAAQGFDAEPYEKVSVLVTLLEGIRDHPFLGSRMALKGGTAVNLFVLPLPRLSIDIDLNYVGRPDRASMLAERPRVERAIEQVCGRAAVAVRRVPAGHAGGKWRLSYPSVLGGTRALELDVNFVLRTPLWPVTLRDSLTPAELRATRIPVLDMHELAAGKLAALLARGACRDVFDVRELIRTQAFDAAKLRLAFVVYGGANRMDWRAASAGQVTLSVDAVRSQLLPTLRQDAVPPRDRVAAWTDALVADTRAHLSLLLPLTEAEREFLDRLNDSGEIASGLLTSDPAMRAVVDAHPGLQWKAMNVRAHLGGGGDEVAFGEG